MPIGWSAWEETAFYPQPKIHTEFYYLCNGDHCQARLINVGPGKPINGEKTTRFVCPVCGTETDQPNQHIGTGCKNKIEEPTDYEYEQLC